MYWKLLIQKKEGNKMQHPSYLSMIGVFWFFVIASLFQSCAPTNHLLTKWKYRKDYKVVNIQLNKSSTFPSEDLVDSVLSNANDDVQFITSNIDKPDKIVLESVSKASAVASAYQNLKAKSYNNRFQINTNINEFATTKKLKKIRDDNKKIHVTSILGLIFGISALILLGFAILGVFTSGFYIILSFIFGGICSVLSGVFGTIGLVISYLNPQKYHHKWIAIVASLIGLLTIISIFIILILVANSIRSMGNSGGYFNSLI